MYKQFLKILQKSDDIYLFFLCENMSFNLGMNSTDTLYKDNLKYHTVDLMHLLQQQLHQLLTALPLHRFGPPAAKRTTNVVVSQASFFHSPLTGLVPRR